MVVEAGYLVRIVDSLEIVWNVVGAGYGEDGGCGGESAGEADHSGAVGTRLWKMAGILKCESVNSDLLRP